MNEFPAPPKRRDGEQRTETRFPIATEFPFHGTADGLLHSIQRRDIRIMKTESA